MTARIDTAAIAWLGHERTDKHAEKLERAALALRLGMPEILLFGLLAPDLDKAAPAIVAGERWAAESSGTWVLAGPVGTGKSLGAARWATMIGARWASASEVSAWSHADAGAKMQRWIDTPALVLDELGGHGSSSQVEIARLAMVLAARHSKLRPTCCTTNLRRADFAELLDGTREAGSRLVDRIVENGEWLDVKGKSRRATPINVRAGQQRYAGLVRMRALVEVADAVVVGCSDDAAAVQQLAEILRATPDDIARARAAINAQHARIDELAGPLLASWARDREAT